MEPLEVNDLNPPETAAPEPPRRAEIGLALLLLYGGTGLLGLLALGVPALWGWLQVLLAGLLFGVPYLMLRGRSATVDEMGVDTGPWRRTLLVASVCMVLVFPPFVLGFHGVETTWMGAEPAWSWDGLSHWDEPLLDEPRDPCAGQREHVAAWVVHDSLWVVGPSEGTLTLEVETDGGSSPKEARAVHCRRQVGPAASSRLAPGAHGRWTAPRGGGIWLALEGMDTLSARIQVDGMPVPADRIARGARGDTSWDGGPLTGTRTPWWILSYLIVHLGLVALPEEWFFRGYLQTRIDQRMGTPWSLWNARFGPGLLLQAAAFALLHPILLPGVHRLLVFFPALLFGWLRARTGNIGSAVVVHACSNLLLAIVTGMYRWG